MGISVFPLAQPDPKPSNPLDYANNYANKYIVKPKHARGIGGFVFDFEGDTTIDLRAEITDHFAEDNSVINDHVALRPARITMHGFKGELIQKPKQGVVGAIDVLQNKLTTIPAYLGKYTPSQVQTVQKALTKAQNAVTTISQTIKRVQNIVGFFDKLFNGTNPFNTKQAKAYAQLESLFKTKQVFTVETPYKYFDNMVIENLSFTQDETNKDWSDISVTLKEVRFVEIKTAPVDQASINRFMTNNSPATDKGATKGSDKGSVSIAVKLLGLGSS